MDLHVESRVHLNGFKTGAIGLSLEHSYSQNGDTCSDPFMEILMYPEGSGPGMVEVYSFDVSIHLNTFWFTKIVTPSIYHRSVL